MKMSKIPRMQKISGAVAVQVYVGKIPSPEDPPKVLVAFKKVILQAGESINATMFMSKLDIAVYDENCGKWFIRGGVYMFMVGKSAGNILVHSEVAIPDGAYDL